MHVLATTQHVDLPAGSDKALHMSSPLINGLTHADGFKETLSISRRNQTGRSGLQSLLMRPCAPPSPPPTPPPRHQEVAAVHVEAHTVQKGRASARLLTPTDGALEDRVLSSALTQRHQGTPGLSRPLRSLIRERVQFPSAHHHRPVT